MTPVTLQLDVQTRALRNDVYVSFPLGTTILDLHLNEKNIYVYIFVIIFMVIFCVLYLCSVSITGEIGQTRLYWI